MPLGTTYYGSTPTGPPPVQNYGQVASNAEGGVGTGEGDLGKGEGWGGYGNSGGLFASGTTMGYSSNPNIYAGEINAANQAAQGYYDQGAGWTQSAPQAQNPYAAGSQRQMQQTYGAQAALAGQLQQQLANPGGSLAAQQQALANQQGISATTALGNSTAGIQASGARRAAQQVNATQSLSNVGQMQQTEAQAQAQAQAQLAGLYGQQSGLVSSQYGLEQQQAMQNAQLQQQQMGVNNSARLGLYGLSANEQALGTNVATGYNNALLGEAGAANSAQQMNQAFGNTVAGAGLSGLGAAYSAFKGAAAKADDGKDNGNVSQ